MHGEYLQKNGTDTCKENLVTEKSSHEKLARTGIWKIRRLEKVITKNWHGQLVEKSVNLENGLKKIWTQSWHRCRRGPKSASKKSGPSRDIGIERTLKVSRKNLDPVVT